MDFSFRNKGDGYRNEFYARMDKIQHDSQYYVGYGNFKTKQAYPKLLLGKQMGDSFWMLRIARKSSFILPRIFLFNEFPFEEFGMFEKTGSLSNYVLVDYQHSPEIEEFVQGYSKSSNLESLIDLNLRITSQDINEYFTESFQDYVSKNLSTEQEFKIRKYHNKPKYLC